MSVSKQFRIVAGITRANFLTDGYYYKNQDGRNVTLSIAYMQTANTFVGNTSVLFCFDLASGLWVQYGAFANKPTAVDNPTASTFVVTDINGVEGVAIYPGSGTNVLSLLITEYKQPVQYL